MTPVLPGIISSNPQTRKDGAGAFHSTKTDNITEKSAGRKTNTNPGTEKFAPMNPSLDFLYLQKNNTT
jgi:hypothetical protein